MRQRKVNSMFLLIWRFDYRIIFVRQPINQSRETKQLSITTYRSFSFCCKHSKETSVGIEKTKHTPTDLIFWATEIIEHIQSFATSENFFVNAIIISTNQSIKRWIEHECSIQDFFNQSINWKSSDWLINHWSIDQPNFKFQAWSLREQLP